MDKVRAPRAVNIAVTVLFVIAFFILLLSLSISLPILNRWFYYVQIGPLGLEEASGHTAAEIKAAYDEILDYLLLPGRQFSAGVFAFSQEGAAHFAPVVKKRIDKWSPVRYHGGQLFKNAMSGLVGLSGCKERERSV